MKIRSFVTKRNLLLASGICGLAISPCMLSQQRPATKVRSKLSIYSLTQKSVEVIYTAEKLIEAPNWSRDGKYLLVNSTGSLWRLPLNNPQLEKLDVGDVKGCNNDHGFSRDGKLLAISAWSAGKPSSHVYIAGADGSSPRLMTPAFPSYFHSWSPNGLWLVYT